MLPSTCSREVLLACPPFPPWNLPSFTVESTLSTPYSRSDPPLSRQGAALAHLDSLLMIWCFGQTALFLFFLAGAAPAFLPTALSVVLRPLFTFQQAQYAQVFPLKPAPFCRHSFLPGNDAADELARRGALLVHSTIPCSLSPRTCRIHSHLISDWRRTVSSKFFDTQVPSISTEELVLPRHARCVLSRLRCNGHSLLLGSY